MITLENEKHEKLILSYNHLNIHIYDSYKVNKNDMKEWLILIKDYVKKYSNYEYKRTIKSWINEWKVHNLLYKLNLFKRRTKDVDLNEDESIIRRFMYCLISKII